jgi:hypothetical protein
MTTRGPLLMASPVYAKRGVLFDSFKKYYGAAGPPDILVAYGTSHDLNPSLPQEEIDRELEKDPDRNRAEYLSEWRDDVSGFIGREIVQACIGDYYELPPKPGNHDAYERDLTTAWRRGGKEAAVPDAPKASGNDEMPVDDMETAYRLFVEQISEASR